MGFAFVSVMQTTLVALVAEKEAKLCETMKMMGLSEAVYWVAAFVTDRVLGGFVTALVIAVVGAPAALFRDVGRTGDFLTLFGFVWCYIMALTAFSFVPAAVLNHATTASVFAFFWEIGATTLNFANNLAKRSASMQASDDACCFLTMPARVGGVLSALGRR